MKKTRRIAAFIAAMAMAACAVAPSMAFADDVNIKVLTDGSTVNETTNVKPDADKATHTYTAYQIFTGEYKLKPGKGEGSTNPEDYEFKVTGLGSDATTNNLLSNAAFLAFKAADDKPTVGEAIGSETGAAAAIAAAQALDGIVDGSPKAQELADILAAAMTTGGNALSTTGADFEEGYYLVKDSYTKAEGGSNDAISDFILRVNSKKDADGITIIPKKSYPEVIKKVQENTKDVKSDWANDGTATRLEENVTVADKWNDVADYNIGDAVPFQLYGSMPATLADYTGYYYKFTDTLGTQFDRPAAVTVNVLSKTGAALKTLEFTWSENNDRYELATGSLEAQDAVTAEVFHYTYKATDTFMSQIDEACATVTGWSDKTNDEKLEYVYDNWADLTAAAVEADEDAGVTAKDAGALVAKGYTSGMNKDKYIIRKKVVDKPVRDAITADASTDGNCRVVWNEGTHKLTVTFEDIKAYDGVDKDTIVTVNYSAKLNNTAVIGLSGQENKVDLTYSNNPNLEYKPYTDDNTEDVPKDENNNEQTDKTPEDRVVVFTYELDITKIDGSTKQKLAGAEFTLSRKNSDNKDEYVQVDTNGKVTGWTTIAANASTLTSGADGLFKIIGLDSGAYTLHETKAPDTYTLPANPDFAVTLTATTDNTQQYTSATYNDATKVLKDIAGKINTADMTKLGAVTGVRGENGGLAGTIENNKGTTLPSTGGMGTKAFVAGGGLTALLAGVWLATKKRMGKED